jgi:hypothetical protein
VFLVSAVLSVLFTRRAFPTALSSLVARLPKGMTPLAAVTLMHQSTGSYATAGVVTAALALGDAAATPFQGRLLDRFGRGRVLVPSAVLYALTLSALPLLVGHRVPVGVLTGCALLAGAGFPPVSGSMKALWPRLVPGGAAGAAYAAESLIQQVLLLVAPLLTTVLLVWSGAAVALWAAAVATLLGTVAFVAWAAPVRDGRPAATGGGGALRVPAIRVLVASTAVQGMVFGALPVIVPALAGRAGAASLAGLLLAAWTFGGITGSLRRTTLRYPVALAGLSAALAVVAVTAAVSGGQLVPVAAALVAAGLFLTPVAAASYLVVGAKARPAHRIEAFAWLSTALAVGGSAGSATAGTAVQHLGPVAAMALPAAVATVATAITLAGRSALDPVASEP